MDDLKTEIMDSITLQDAIIKMLLYSRRVGAMSVELPDLTSDVIAGIYRKKGFSIISDIGDKKYE
ncbi:MAG: hypothetical protein ABIM30_00155 [candidate division WOR-3 bacterium]